MKDKTIIYKSGYLTVASGADQSWELPVGLGCHFYLQFGNITTLTCSVTVSYDGGTQYVNVVSVTSAGTSVAAGGTITTADGLKVYFDAEGATHVKVTYVGGTDGPVRLMGTDGADGLVAARLLQLIASGITVNSDTGYADDGTGFTLSTSELQAIGGVAVETDGTAPGTVAEGDAAVARTDRNRLLIVNQTHPFSWDVSVDYGAAQTNASIKAAPGASLSLYITDIFLSNGAVAGNVTLLDGSGGTVKWEAYPAINGGAKDQRRTPIRLTANTALCITSTTVTTHSLTISGYTAP